MAIKQKHRMRAIRRTWFSNFVILGGTYALAFLILNFSNMNPLVVALLPCLAFTLTIITRK